MAALEQGVPHGTRLEEVIYEVLDQRYLEEEAYDRIGEVMDTVFGLKVDRGEMTANFTGKVLSISNVNYVFVTWPQHATSEIDMARWSSFG